jgi:hypothetical protein
MTVPAWDLDAPAETPLAVGGGGSLGPLLAICLAGLGVGGLVGSALSPTTAPSFPPIATLSIREVYVDASEPLPPTSSSAAATNTATTSAAATNAASATSNPTASALGNPTASAPGSTVGATSASTASPTAQPTALKGQAVVVLRLQVENPAAGPLRLTALRLDGVTSSSNLLPLDLLVAGHRSAQIDLPVRPDCSPGRKPAAVRARLTSLPGSGSDGFGVAPSRALIQPGGLCSQVDSQMPNGWRTPLLAYDARLDGIDLEVTVDELSEEKVVGLLVDGQLQPTVFAGEELLNTTARLERGEAPRLRLRGPPPCPQPGSSAPVPSTLRLLVPEDGGIQPRLVIVGSALTQWLQLDCGR